MQHSLDRDTACKLQLCHHGLFFTRNSCPPGITAVIIFQSWKLYIYICTYTHRAGKVPCAVQVLTMFVRNQHALFRDEFWLY